MKTMKSLWLLCILTLVFVSCQKADLSSLKSQNGDDQASTANYGSDNDAREEGASTLSTIYDWEEFCHNPPENDGVDTSSLTFCTRKSVPLCTSRGINVGSVTVKTGSDKNTYVTYALNSGWYFDVINLYVGTESGIPLTAYGYALPSKFNYIRDLRSPKQSWSFVITGLPSYFTVAANASVAKVQYNRVVDMQAVWGDGCSGTRINQSNWATKFNYVKGNCMTEDEEICAKPVNYFFDSTINGADIAWPDVNGSPIAELDSLGQPVIDLLGLPVFIGNDNANVTIGGQNYTEAEGRAIFQCYTGATMSDSKNGFINLAALKLSATAYNQAKDATLLMAVNTIETWLMTKGKLCPTNLPTGNTAVRNAANFVSTWIKIYTCSDRR